MWCPLEADFLRFYGIHNVLDTRWHKFLRFIAYLPPEDSIFLRILSGRQVEYLEDGTAVPKGSVEANRAKQELRKQHKRDGKPRQKMSLSQFLNESPSAGSIKGTDA